MVMYLACDTFIENHLTTIDSTFFLKLMPEKSRSQWSLNCICTDSVIPRCVHKSNLGFLGCMHVDTILLDLMAVVKVRDAP